MLKWTLASILLASLFFVLGTDSSAAGTQTEQKAQVPNIGIVVYTKSRTPGTLTARWNFGNRYSGPGLAMGGQQNDFAGSYHVRYFLNDGTFSDEYDLVIHPSSGFYAVCWMVDGVIKAKGVGMLVEQGNALAVGWHRVGPEETPCAT